MTSKLRGAAGVRRRELLTGSSALIGSALGAPFLSARTVFAQAAKTEITFASSPFFSASSIAELLDRYHKAQAAVHVTFVELPPPGDSTAVHKQLADRLGARDGTPDVFTQDIVWVAEFAAAGWAMPLGDSFDSKTMQAYFPGVVAGCTVKGELVAMPWFMDCGMLFYRTDILERIGAAAPETWDDLVATARKGTGGGVKYGFLWQGKKSEALVCNLVSVIGSNGGSILDADGVTVKIGEANAVAAVEMLRDLIVKQKVSPAAVLGWDEEPSRKPFTGGQSVFLRNWSYTWSVAQNSDSKIAGKIGVAPLPHFPGKKSAACLGGYQYGVNASSKNKTAAIDFLRWLSRPETQLHFAAANGLSPTRMSVLDDPLLAKSQPFMARLKDVFAGALARPVTSKYPAVTRILQAEISNALAKGSVAEALAAAQTKIDKVLAA